MFHQKTNIQFNPIQRKITISILLQQIHIQTNIVINLMVWSIFLVLMNWIFWIAGIVYSPWNGTSEGLWTILILENLIFSSTFRLSAIWIYLIPNHHQYGYRIRIDQLWNIPINHTSHASWLMPIVFVKVSVYSCKTFVHCTLYMLRLLISLKNCIKCVLPKLLLSIWIRSPFPCFIPNFIHRSCLSGSWWYLAAHSCSIRNSRRMFRNNSELR